MKKKHEFLTVILFCGFLAVMLLGYLFLPKQDYSEKEKRFLEDAPALVWEDIASGQWGEDAESYMADHIPGRDFFVGLNAYFDLLTGRQEDKSSLRDEMLHTVACKAAIKAGWVNDEKELLAVAREVMARDDLKHCPHGRPICITLSKKQLEKQFKRT